MFVLFLIYLNIHRSFRISFIFRLRMIVTGPPGWLILLASVTWPQLSTGIYLSIYISTDNWQEQTPCLPDCSSVNFYIYIGKHQTGRRWSVVRGARCHQQASRQVSRVSSKLTVTTQTNGRKVRKQWHTLLMQYPHSHNPPGPLTLVLSECIPVSDLRGGADGRVQPEHDETLRARRAAHSNTVMKSGFPSSSQSRILSHGCVSQVSSVKSQTKLIGMFARKL